MAKSGPKPKYDYDKPEVIEAKFKEYLKYCKTGDSWPHINKRGQLIKEKIPYIPSIRGFNWFLGFSREGEIDRLAKKNEKMSMIVSRVKEEINLIRDSLSESGVIEPQIARLDYAHRNRLTEPKHKLEIDIGKNLREALDKSKPKK